MAEDCHCCLFEVEAITEKRRIVRSSYGKKERVVALAEIGCVFGGA